MKSKLILAIACALGSSLIWLQVAPLALAQGNMSDGSGPNNPGSNQSDMLPPTTIGGAVEQALLFLEQRGVIITVEIRQVVEALISGQQRGIGQLVSILVREGVPGNQASAFARSLRELVVNGVFSVAVFIEVEAFWNGLEFQLVATNMSDGTNAQLALFPSDRLSGEDSSAATSQEESVVEIAEGELEILEDVEIDTMDDLPEILEIAEGGILEDLSAILEITEVPLDRQTFLQPGEFPEVVAEIAASPFVISESQATSGEQLFEATASRANTAEVSNAQASNAQGSDAQASDAQSSNGNNSNNFSAGEYMAGNAIVTTSDIAGAFNFASYRIRIAINRSAGVLIGRLNGRGSLAFKGRTISIQARRTVQTLMTTGDSAALEAFVVNLTGGGISTNYAQALGGTIQGMISTNRSGEVTSVNATKFVKSVAIYNATIKASSAEVLSNLPDELGCVGLSLSEMRTIAAAAAESELAAAE